MALRTIDLKSYDVSIAITSGTSLGFKADGLTIPNGIHMVATVDEDYATRRQMTAKVRPATVDAKTGAYSKDKKSVSFAFPFLTADGKIVFNSIRVEREMHPLAADGTGDWLNKAAAQVLMSSDAANFWGVGSFD